MGGYYKLKKKIMYKRLYLLVGIFIGFNSMDANGQSNEQIRYGASFLTITPDARSAGIGDQGVASSPDNHSQYWNAAKYLFSEDRLGVSFTYTPWLRNISDDISLSYLSGFYKVDEKQSVSASLRYFTLGEISFNDVAGNFIRSHRPNELAFDVGYARQLMENLSASVTFRYLNSNLAGRSNIPTLSNDTRVANSFAADIGVYSQRLIGSNELAWGVSLSNLGPKVSYSTADSKWFQPTTLRLGARYSLDLMEEHQLSFMGEMAKLLIPSPSYDANGYDLNSGKSVVGALFSSFGDSRQGGKGEIKELVFSLGAEYTYHQLLRVSTGYFHESQEQGNRKFLGFGLGLAYRIMHLDLSYMVQTSKGGQNPLDNTIRVSVGYRLP